MLHFILFAQVLATSVVPLSNPDAVKAKGKAGWKGGAGAFVKSEQLAAPRRGVEAKAGRKPTTHGKGAGLAAGPALVCNARGSYDVGSLPKPRFGGAKNGDRRGH